MRYQAILAGLLLMSLLAACADDNRAWTTQDAWYRPAPTNVAFGQWPSLDRTRIHAVAEGQEAAAEKLLATVPAVELTAQQATDLVGRPLPDVAGAKPYLVRAVYLNRETGQFLVNVSGDQLAVTHRSMGSQAVPMRRQALVLQLERAPAEVFVGASMTQ
jgi:hypothetical protein